MRSHQNNLLLIEMVIVILFFALSQAVVLQVFTKAQQINQDAQIADHALMRAEDTAETLAVQADAEAALLSLGFSLQDHQYILVDEDGYRLEAGIDRLSQPAGTLTTVEIRAYQKDHLLFTLPAVQYREATAP